ncbi:transcriptional regulator NrdR [Marinilactibacillus sp. XAAS-LB27]|uniref:transcriptional regulator NrdR n=1 Tax=unclassified Marinilactibacillus TaxID=2632303 RepID=UPI001CE3CCE1|nr:MULTISPECIES: transcriptional regulator NrdR [unclassified Marinilactibacillus]MEC6749064.1 transcriptional regulator NrdR [Marinilactibacillus sp. XAAS-LB27]
MQCPRCQHNGSRVVDSRPADENKATRRRRECESCGFRFTTFERLEQSPILVVKKDKTREEFSREKLLRGLRRAFEKRPVTAEEQEKIVTRVEYKIRDRGDSEIESTKIGEYIMQELAEVDDVAYIRFASVYRQFKDIEVFMKEMQELAKKRKNDK